MATFSSVLKHPDINRQRMAIEELNRCRQYTDQLIGLMHDLPHGSSGSHPAADRLLSEVLFSITCALAVLDSRPQQSTPSGSKEGASDGDVRGCSVKRKGSPQLELEHDHRKSKRRDSFRSTSLDDRVCLATTTNAQHISPAVPRISAVPDHPRNTCKADPMPKEPEVILENSNIVQEPCVLDCAANPFNGVQLDCDSFLLEPSLSASKVQNIDPFPTLQVSTNPCYEYDAATHHFPPSPPSSIDFELCDELFQEYLSSWLSSP